MYKFKPRDLSAAGPTVSLAIGVQINGSVGSRPESVDAELRVPRFLIQPEGEFPAFMRVPRFLIQPEGEFPAFIRPL
jgi:hypothetical protein